MDKKRKQKIHELIEDMDEARLALYEIADLIEEEEPDQAEDIHASLDAIEAEIDAIASVAGIEPE